MNNTSAQEQQYESQLNQAKVSIKTTETSGGLGPATLVTAGEFVIVLGAAIIVDIIDALDLTGFGAILVRFIDIPILGALWLWRLLKSGPRKDPTIALLTSFLVEISPIGIVPTWTVFVVYTYFQDTRIGRKTVGKVKKMIKVKKIKK